MTTTSELDRDAMSLRLPAADLLRWIAETRALLDRLERGLAPASSSQETLDAWVERWTEHRRGRVSRPDDERRTYVLWIQPKLGCRPVAAISRDDLEEWVEDMDQRVADGELMGSTANRIWSLLRSMMRDAAGSKVRALRVRTDNPAESVRPPDSTAPRASTFLYPSEFVQLVTCEDVPLGFRRLYACAVYLYPRAGELRALRWSDLDLATGRVHIHRSLDREGVEGRTKTENDRQFVCERKLLPLLRAMRREARGRGRVFPEIKQRDQLARALRLHLEYAGCERADLFADDESRRPLTFHDLRATGITWQAMRGDAPTDIMERVGHADLKTTQRYMRRGRLMALARGERVFPPLPKCLLRRG